MAPDLWRRLGLLILLVLLLPVQACREEEQDRVLVDEKGVYQGEPDQDLSDEQVGELRARARAQRF